MFKQIFQLLFKLIFQPARAWRILSEEKDTNNDIFLKSYLYPIFGMIGLCAFVGIFINYEGFDLQAALQAVIRSLVTVFVGFFLASFLLVQLLAKVFLRQKEHKICQRFTGYSSALIYAIYLVSGLLPEFFFLKILVVYTIYIIWEGSISYMGIDDNKRLYFTLMSSAIIILSPYLMELILTILMSGVKA